MFRSTAARSLAAAGGLHPSFALLGPTHSGGSSSSGAGGGGGRGRSRAPSYSSSTTTDTSVPLPAAKVGRAAAQALGLARPDRFPSHRGLHHYHQEEEASLVALGSGGGGGGGQERRRLITPPVDATGGRADSDNAELAALVATHKALHGSVTPPPPPPVHRATAAGNHDEGLDSDDAFNTEEGDEGYGEHSSASIRSGGRRQQQQQQEDVDVDDADIDQYDADDGDGDHRRSTTTATTASAVSAKAAAKAHGVSRDLLAADLRAALAASAAIPTAAAATAASTAKGRRHNKKAATRHAWAEEEDDDRNHQTGLSIPPAGIVTTALLANPFRGIHGCVERSYRLDQLTATAAPSDALFGRQERKSTAFSFLRFRGGRDLYEGSWGSLPDLQAMHHQHQHQHQQQLPSGTRGKAVPGFSLFNNNLGLHDPRVTSSFPLLLAQRLLLFPDSMRHFHTLCGREDVPCDFYADVDLPDTSPKDGEQVLLEILNYLEVRLPGVGFTDPFFLVLTNEVPSKEKVSYHIHARSMTYLQEEKDMSIAQAAAAAVRDERSRKRRLQAAARKRTAGKNRNGTTTTATNSDAAGEDEEDAIFDDMIAADYDDLSDLVNVVDGGSSCKKKKRVVTVPRVIAFHDYRTVKVLAEEVNQTLGRTVIDDSCYRQHGMLRCAYSAKLASSQDADYHSVGAAAATNNKRRLVPLLTATDPALQQRLSRMEAVLRTMTDPEILELSFANRYVDDADTAKLVLKHVKASAPPPRSRAATAADERLVYDRALRAAHRHRFRLIRQKHVLGPQSEQALEFDSYGNAVSPFLTEGAKWRRYNQVVQKLRTLPARAAEGYDVWVRIGLALHNFTNEDHVFEEWVRFSLRSPQKYSRERCRRKWLQFERNPDALNWRRGFNYLNSTVWRQV